MGKPVERVLWASDQRAPLTLEDRTPPKTHLRTTRFDGAYSKFHASCDHSSNLAVGYVLSMLEHHSIESNFDDTSLTISATRQPLSTKIGYCIQILLDEAISGSHKTAMCRYTTCWRHRVRADVFAGGPEGVERYVRLDAAR